MLFSRYVVSDSATLWTAALQASLSITNSRSLLKLMSIESVWTAAHQASLSITNSRSLLRLVPIDSVMPSSHLILCRPLLLPSIVPSIRVFSNESALHIRWPKYGSFSFSISPSTEYSGLISFRMDWLELLAVHKPCNTQLENGSQAGYFSSRQHLLLWAVVCKLNSKSIQRQRLTMKPGCSMWKQPGLGSRAARMLLDSTPPPLGGPCSTGSLPRGAA